MECGPFDPGGYRGRSGRVYSDHCDSDDRNQVVREELFELIGEFDPGSGRTLAACLTHASRTGKWEQSHEYSGARVSNT